MTISRPTQATQHLDVEEVDLIPFEFGKSLLAGESIASAALSCTLHAGVDSSPALLLQGPPQIAGTQVLQMVAGRITDATYHLRCVATLSSGRKVVVACYLPCVTL
jgi:hypothetical protein